MREAGFERQPVAFVPPEGFWDMVKELCPDKFAAVHGDLTQWVLELLKAAYGLKDAPLVVEPQADHGANQGDEVSQVPF